MGYCGRLVGEETGLMYARNRMYGPNGGRYLSRNSYYSDIGLSYIPEREEAQKFGRISLINVEMIEPTLRYIDGYSLYVRDAGGLDPSGLPVSITLTTANPDFVANFTNPPGTMSVAAHGSVAGVERGDLLGKGPLAPSTYISVKDLAAIIRQSPDYSPGVIVILISCNVGNGNYAQELADELHSKVLAATDVVKPIGKNGRYVIGDPEAKPPHYGKWKDFWPNTSPYLIKGCP